MLDQSLDNSTQFLLELRSMMTKVQRCLLGGTEFSMQCSSAVIEKSFRKMPFMKRLIYPWQNYDWDYSQYVKNYYSPKKLGASGDGSVKALIRDINALFKIIDGLLFDANPNSKSRSADPASQQNDLANCYQTASRVSCFLLNETRSSYLKEKPPYNSSFFNQPLKGKYSSSYFTQIGICPSKIKNPSECRQKGGNWIANPFHRLPALLRGPDSQPGNCFLGRYAYIDNSPGLSIGQMDSAQGMIPSIANDILKLSPDKLMGVAMGNGVPGMDLQKCEGFLGHNDSIKRPNTNTFFILIIIFISLLVAFVSKKISF